LLVDGTLKSDESKVNSLSDFSRKARIKGTRDISVLFAFDLEAMEPVCSKCFPGNMLDATSYEAFIKENRITKGIIVGDKGFPESAAHKEFESHPDLHYLNPIKRNSKLIARHSMLDFTAILPGFEGITCRKEKCVGIDKWLYSYRSSAKAAKEESDWLRRAKKEKTYSLEKLREKQKTFGTIVLECDLDLPPEIAYKAYANRWEIELVMRYYKSACEFDETRVQDDYSVIGSEFCDFLSTLLTFRLINAFDKAGLLEDYTYRKILSVLIRAKKARVGSENWQLVRMNPSHLVVLQKLDLIPKPEEPPKKKPGRPRGSKNRPKAKAT
jgi:transposase